MSQYADDTTLILDGTKESLTAALKTLDDFYEVYALKLNDKKTEAFWIGANCGKGELSIPGKYFKRPKYKVRALGIWFSNDPEATATLNYNVIYDKKAWNGTGEHLHECKSRSAPQTFWALVPHFIWDRYVYTLKIWSAVPKNGRHGAKNLPCRADFFSACKWGFKHGASQ